jgi:hypothetical protein
LRVFKSKEFARFARKNGLDDPQLCTAVADIHAGRIDADLGGSVYKQRIARSGEGKSGGYRTILLLRWSEICIFIFGYAKKDRANVSFADVALYREIAKNLLVREELIQEAIREEKLIEVVCDGETIPK